MSSWREVLVPYGLFGLLLFSSLQSNAIEAARNERGRLGWKEFLLAEAIAVAFAVLWPVILPLMLWDAAGSFVAGNEKTKAG